MIISPQIVITHSSRENLYDNEIKIILLIFVNKKMLINIFLHILCKTLNNIQISLALFCEGQR